MVAHSDVTTLLPLKVLGRQCLDLCEEPAEYVWDSD